MDEVTNFNLVLMVREHAPREIQEILTELEEMRIRREVLEKRLDQVQRLFHAVQET